MPHNVGADVSATPSIRHYDMRNAIVDWLARLDMQYFITFNFNHDETLPSGRIALSRFHSKLDRKLFGAGFHRRTADDRTLFVAFPEHIDSNLHYHALVRTPSDEFARVAEPIWLKMIPSGQLYISDWKGGGNHAYIHNTVVFEENMMRIARYITKDTKYDDNYENFIISSEFSSR